MSLTKMIYLIMIAAIGALALIGASNAMAEGSTSWCKKRETPCPEAQLYLGGQHFKAEATNVELLTSGFTVKCASAFTLGNLLNELANPLETEITALSFTNCKSGAMTCEIKTVAFGKELFLRIAETYTATVTVHNTSWLVKCGALIHCVYGGLHTFTFYSTTGGGEEEKAPDEKEETAVETESMGCPATAKWDGDWIYSLPLPIYISS